MADGKLEIPEIVTTWFRAAVLAAALLAFCTQPLMRFVDADRFLGGGALLAGSFCGFAMFISEPKAIMSIGYGVVAAILTLVGAYFLITGATQASAASVANDQRCLVIQRDMLSAKPRLSNGPDLFQALGCRPQGGGGVAALENSRTR